MSTKRKFSRYTRKQSNVELKNALLLGSSSASRRTVAELVGDEQHSAQVSDTSFLFESRTLELESGEFFEWIFYHPAKLVQHILDTCPNLASAYLPRLQQNPPSAARPWRILVGFDEQTPGSKVNHDNRRKLQCLIFNFLEVGPELLETDASWFVPVILRSKKMNALDGAWSRCLRIFLRTLLLGPLSFRVGGVFVECRLAGLGDQRLHLRAKLAALLTDGEGHAKSLEWNGHGSMRPCFMHSNIFKKHSGMEDEELGYVSITCSQRDRLRRWSVSDLHANIDRIREERRRHERGELRTTALKTIIKAAGWHPSESGVMADDELRDAEQIFGASRYDWMHCAMQDGFMSNAMYLVVRHVLIINHGGANDATVVQNYLRSCKFPFMNKNVGPQLYRIFSQEMMKKHTTKKAMVANASAQLSLYLIIEEWALLEAVHSNGALRHVAVYSAVCRIIDIIMAAKHRRLSTVAAQPMLYDAIARWQDLHKAVYGTRYIKPKHCWIWGVAEQFADFEWVFDMWCIERQHKWIRPLAEVVKNTKTFEASVLLRALDTQVSKLLVDSTLQAHVRLIGRTALTAYGVVPAGVMADKCSCNGVEYAIHDIILFDGQAGAIRACILSHAGAMVFNIQVLQKIAEPSTWTRTSETEMWQADGVLRALAWRELADGTVFTIVGRL